MRQEVILKNHALQEQVYEGTHLFSSIDPKISFLKYGVYNLQSDSTRLFTLPSQQLSR